MNLQVSLANNGLGRERDFSGKIDGLYEGARNALSKIEDEKMRKELRERFEKVSMEPA